MTDAPKTRLKIGEVSFEDLMALVQHGPDTFVGVAPRYPWGRLFGGQVVAQALRAAQFTVDERFGIHSLHAYFIRGGTHREPVRFEVDRIRNGRSFATRRVVARQSNGAILNLSASFQRDEESVDVQPSQLPVDIPRPEDIEDSGWGQMLERRRTSPGFGRSVTWLRLAQDLPADPLMQACALAFISDAAPTGAARAAHPVQIDDPDLRRAHFTGASLDHAVYFHRPIDPTEWLVADVLCHTLVGARGITVGNIFTADGVHGATIVQEVLLRERRPNDETPQGSPQSDGLGGKDT